MFERFVDNDPSINDKENAPWSGALARRSSRLARQRKDRYVDTGGLAAPGGKSQYIGPCPGGIRLRRTDTLGQSELPRKRIKGLARIRIAVGLTKKVRELFARQHRTPH
jgi:hypothetical protein